MKRVLQYFFTFRGGRGTEGRAKMRKDDRPKHVGTEGVEQIPTTDGCQAKQNCLKKESKQQLSQAGDNQGQQKKQGRRNVSRFILAVQTCWGNRFWLRSPAHFYRGTLCYNHDYLFYLE